MSELCMSCGQPNLTERVVPFDVERDGQTVTIQDRQMWCSACGQVSYHGNQISTHELAVANAMRQMLGLLRPDELKAVREKYFLLQREMEDILNIGPKTWIRWERGKVVHSKSVDTLIRSVAADPALAHRLVLERGIDNPEANAAFQRFHEQARMRAASVLQAKLGDLVGADYIALAGEIIDVLQSERITVMRSPADSKTNSRLFA